MVSFDGEGRDVLTARSDERVLSPGRYGKIVVAPGAQLRMESGQYVIEELYVPASGVLLFENGETDVRIRSALEHLGATRYERNADVLLAYFGSQQASLAASFEGAVIAPSAALRLGSAGNAQYAGAFFARWVAVAGLNGLSRPVPDL